MPKARVIVYAPRTVGDLLRRRIRVVTALSSGAITGHGFATKAAVTRDICQIRTSCPAPGPFAANIPATVR